MTSGPIPTDLGRALDRLTKAGNPGVKPPKVPAAWTPRMEVGENGGEVVSAPVQAKILNGEQKRALLEQHDLNPDEWELTNYRRSVWDAQVAGGGIEQLTSHRFTLVPSAASVGRPNVDELLKLVKGTRKPVKRPDGDWGYVHLAADWQLGKVDGDGAEGIIKRIMESLDLSVAQLRMERKHRSIGHVHVAFLGDHSEGFVSQGGANAWRTSLTQTEQMRMVRRLMMAHVQSFASLAERVTFVAIPGNHGDAVRFGKSGTTRYDDNYDVEGLVSVADAAAMVPALEHVEFFTPAVDEMTVLTEVAGTALGHMHGHQFKTGQHWGWWDSNCANGRDIGGAKVMVTGHHHSFQMQERGDRTFIQSPAQESASMWWTHKTGMTGNPGSVSFVTKNNIVRGVNILR